jgi:hypothetical protein
MHGLVPLMGVPRGFSVCPPTGGARASEGGEGMKFIRRVVIALGSLAALALAGGAHWRAG